MFGQACLLVSQKDASVGRQLPVETNLSLNLSLNWLFWPGLSVLAGLFYMAPGRHSGRLVSNKTSNEASRAERP